ncbi:receptor-like protein 12 [Pyrus ussuriensis x Pyrus communis]|uniref:Receptor-like protein 12 n=1 Tax=Pyrus ussuriensis x Pyrus communis TaxID=2448454 RepID=A0A5N5HC28_9ROSA|nr:receptor-like protein 12 [Pyrus ussuriensis x Pyrus communis]
MEKITLESRGEVSKLCFLTGSLQRRLNLEYSTPKNGYAREMMREESLEKELIIPLFPVLEEKRDKGKKKEGFGVMKGKLLLEKPQANMMIDIYPFTKAPINMINLTWAEKRKGKVTWEVKVEMRQVDKLTEGTIKLPEKLKAAIVKGLVLCSKCQCVCELEKLIRRKEKEKQEAHRSIMHAIEKETSRNVFQRLGGDSQPKG